jgi:hypothetical protein
MVSFGSEFWDPIDLEPLLYKHPNWPALKEILENGASFPLRPISVQDWKIDLEFHVSRGNHKSAEKHKDALDGIIENDIHRGFALPLLIDILFDLPGASLAPLGCVDQDTINERGERTKRFRMMHDQSFLGPSQHSVNERVIKELLPHCMYSFVLLRILHYIVSLRGRHYSMKIFLSKFDLDLVYHHCHLSGITAVECLAIHKDTLLMALRMTFGGSPCPSMVGYTSETITDICNTLIQCSSWDYF